MTNNVDKVNEEIVAEQVAAKREYQKPELTVYGKVEKLTLQTNGGIPG